MRPIHDRQSGNVFMMILIGIVLFSALAFTFVRSGRQGASNISSQEASIAATSAMSYARKIEQGLNRLRTKGISESDIDFVGAGSAYDNTGCSIDKCQLFHPAGGQQVWQSTVHKANDGSEWVFTGSIAVTDVGTDGGGAKSSELVMILPNVNVGVCRQMNTELGIDNPGGSPPLVTGSVTFSAKYIGTFTAGSTISSAVFDGRSAGCFGNGGNYHFYQVLLAR